MGLSNGAGRKVRQGKTGPAWLTHNLGHDPPVLVWGGTGTSWQCSTPRRWSAGKWPTMGCWGAFSAACNTHNDYVWKSEARSTLTPEADRSRRGPRQASLRAASLRGHAALDLSNQWSTTTG